MYSATSAGAAHTAGTGASITAVIGLSQQGDGTTGETLRIGVHRVSGSRGGEVLHPRRKFGRQQLVVEQEPSRVRGFEGIVVVWLPQKSQEQCGRRPRVPRWEASRTHRPLKRGRWR